MPYQNQIELFDLSEITPYKTTEDGYTIQTASANGFRFVDANRKVYLEFAFTMSGELHVLTDFGGSNAKNYTKPALAFFQHLSIVAGRRRYMGFEQALNWWKQGYEVYTELDGTKYSVSEMMLENVMIDKSIMSRLMLDESWYVAREKHTNYKQPDEEASNV